MRLAWVWTLATVMVAPITATIDYCLGGEFTSNETCNDKQPRDLLLVLDGSNTIAEERFFGEILDFALSVFCRFDVDAPNQLGIVVFGKHVQVRVPLAQYSRQEWEREVESLRAMRGTTDNPPCCDCCVSISVHVLKEN